LPEATFQHSSHSIHPHVSITKFFPKIRRDRKAWAQVVSIDIIAHQYPKSMTLDSAMALSGQASLIRDQKRQAPTTTPPGISANISDTTSFGLEDKVDILCESEDVADLMRVGVRNGSKRIVLTYLIPQIYPWPPRFYGQRRLPSTHMFPGTSFPFSS
jgi:hypothetical protein